MPLPLLPAMSPVAAGSCPTIAGDGVRGAVPFPPRQNLRSPASPLGPGALPGAGSTGGGCARPAPRARGGTRGSRPGPTCPCYQDGNSTVTLALAPRPPPGTDTATAAPPRAPGTGSLSAGCRSRRPPPGSHLSLADDTAGTAAADAAEGTLQLGHAGAVDVELGPGGARPARPRHPGTGRCRRAGPTAPRRRGPTPPSRAGVAVRKQRLYW